jgi:adenine-specific DNA-methyltransferase
MTDNDYEIREIPGTSPVFKNEIAIALADLLPEVISDGKIDVEKLRQILGEDLTDERERFGLSWPGKMRALRAAQEPTTATLKPVLDNSKNWEHTKNVFIEGDNLETLKILQKHYHGKIKLIYIDPPYNTGKDFVYPDNFREGLETYLEWSRQVNEEGKKLSSNSESEGRYHSNWLNMMYPRLKLARNLLTNDGAIFISIDDVEQAHLRKLCDEVFGEANFVGNIIWEKKYTRANDAKYFSDNHDHLLCYARKKDDLNLKLLPRDESQLAAYVNPDNHPKGAWKATPLHAKSGSNSSSYTFTNGVIWTPPTGTFRRFNDQSMQSMDVNDEIWFGSDGKQTPSRKSFLSEVKDGVTPVTIWPYTEVGHTHEANNELKQLGLGGIFDNPKPTRLIRRTIELISDGDDFVLDFFAGSGTTGQAVLAQNAADGKNRKFILVQLPEPTPEESEARNQGYKSIADITRARITNAGRQLEDQIIGSQIDTGFRSYKLTDTNFSKWQVASDIEPNVLEQHILDLRDSASDEASQEAVLAEILLKLGYSLSQDQESIEVEGLEVFSLNENLVVAYMNSTLKPTIPQIRAILDLKPAKFIILEDAFQGDDQLKTNVVQECKSRKVELWTA